MSTLSSFFQKTAYIFNAENPAEMVRLTEQNRLFSKTMGGPLAGLPDPATFSKVLDVACGPGDWAMDVAFAQRHIEVAGIDFHRTAIHYAIAKARSQRLKNVSFEVMNWLRPLDFSDNTFDIINGAFLAGSMPRTSWSAVLGEFWRILRPGGILRLIDSDRLFTSGPASQKITSLFLHALHLAGYGFSPDGQSMGLTPVLESLFIRKGYQQIRYTPSMINFSANASAWQDMYHNLDIAGQALYPLVVELEGISLVELEALHQRSRVEMMSEDFSGMWPFFSITGVKA